MKKRTLVGFLGIALAAAGCAPSAPPVTQQRASLGSQDRYIVVFKDGKLGMAALQAAGAEVLFELTRSNAAAAKIPAAALAGLQRNPNVATIEPDAERHLLSQTVPYGISMVQADLVPFVDPATGAAKPANRKVCIIDTGYDFGHPDLPTVGVTSAYHPCDPTSRKCRATTGDPLTDGNGHGTHVAGTIAGLNNDVGVIGVMPAGNVQLHIIKIFGEDGSWVTRVSNLIRALEQCRDAGANVVSMSLGGGSPSDTERAAFDSALAAGVLPIAAASNDSNTSYSYPASYNSVVSVAAVDENMNHASFSNWNDQVELAAPGVNVLSTIPRGYGLAGAASVGSSGYPQDTVNAFLGSPVATVAAGLVDCGLGDIGRYDVYPYFSAGSCPAATGKICVIQRGEYAFAEKIANCQTGGGVGAIIYNNVDGTFASSVRGAGTTIPSVSISQADGKHILANLMAETATITVTLSGYDYASFNGTSMATPHAAGVAALVWSQFPGCSAADIRGALTASALDLGATGRDVKFGYGLVQAQAAVQQLTTNGCALPPPPPPPPPPADCKASGVKCKKSADCCSGTCNMVNPSIGYCG